MWERQQRGEPPASFAVGPIEAIGDAAPVADVNDLAKRAVVLHQQGSLGEAASVYREILRQRPRHFDALHLLGVIENQQGRPAEACRLIGEALSVNSQSADAFSNHGNALRALGRFAEAVASYDQALAIRPEHVVALVSRGNALQNLKRYDDALASYDRVLAIKADSAVAIFNRGIALQHLRRYEDALASYDRALAITPDYAEVFNNRAGCLHRLGRHDEAARDYANLLRVAPDYPFARGSLFHSRARCWAWQEFDSGVESLVNEVLAGKRCVAPFIFLSVSGSTVAQLRCAQTYVEANYPASLPAVFEGGGYAHERIRVAYLSTDLREHAVSILMAGVFEQHDRARFETLAISFGPDDVSEMGKRVKSAFDRFIDVRRKTDLEVAQLMRELEIDIAVDLMGFTGDTRTGIFAYRPAPVQVSYLGFPGTMGAPYIDYLLADRYVIPAEHEAAYAEKVVRLPDTFQANDAKRKIAEKTPTRAEAGLPDDGFVFCCFNNSYKITPQLFGVWMRLLTKVEGSVLWLVKDRPSVENNLRNEAAARGLDPGRLVFAPRLPYPEHLARYRLAGLFLDTLPFNAGTTASDALWAGLPLLTCSGEAYAARMAGSLLNAVGLPELVTHTLEDYEALALKLATDAGLLAGIRAKLAQHRTTHPLFDTPRFTRHLESAYTTMWERQQRGEPPAGFAVEAIGERMPAVPGT
jgi:predicted O-linked N-acetylglucosamine transferase (SPINDLY family)